MQRTIRTGGGELTYELTRKAVKNINLRVQPDGTLQVSAPRRTAAEQVDAFVRQKAAWIARARVRQGERRAAADGAVWLLGRRLRVQARPMAPGEREGAILRGDVLTLTVRDSDRCAPLIRAFLEQEGARVFPDALRRMHRLVEPLGVPLPVMSTRWARTRWGSCSYKAGRISINKALVCVPPACIELVMLHELVHFVHPNHSAAFHAEMAALLPDCREREAQLRAFSPAVDFDKVSLE